MIVLAISGHASDMAGLEHEGDEGEFRQVVDVLGRGSNGGPIRAGAVQVSVLSIVLLILG